MGKAIGGVLGAILTGVAIWWLTQGVNQNIVNRPQQHVDQPEQPAGRESHAPIAESPKPHARMSSPEVDTDREHGDYKDVAVKDLDECLAVCLAEDRCQAVSFNRASNQCWMKDSVPVRSARPGFTASVKFSE